MKSLTSDRVVRSRLHTSTLEKYTRSYALSVLLVPLSSAENGLHVAYVRVLWA